MARGFWINESRSVAAKEVEVEHTNHDTPKPTDSYTFELPYDNDLDQEELNRRLRKPGEPGYCPSAKRGEATDSPNGGPQAPSDTEARKRKSP
jgi:hypothetical protein